MESLILSKVGFRIDSYAEGLKNGLNYKILFRSSIILGFLSGKISLKQILIFLSELNWATYFLATSSVKKDKSSLV